MPPPYGLLKINIDEFLQGNQGGAGFVIKDHDGWFMLYVLVFMIELTATWKRLINNIKYLQCKKIILEGDLLTVITWINTQMHSTPSISLFHDIRHIISSLNHFKAERVLREANSVEDWLMRGDVS